MSLIMDADQHLYERPDMWLNYCDPKDRELAVTMEPDDLGYWWITVPELKRKAALATVPQPNTSFNAAFGSRYANARAGIPSEQNYLEDLPDSYWNPSARVAKLDEWGIEKTLLFSNYQMAWPRVVPKSRVDIMRTNIGAWNRWAVEVRQESKGRLEPVGQFTLRGGDMSWAVEQIEYLAANGIKAVTFTYGLIDGRRPSHPDHDRVWKAIADHGMAAVQHVQDSDERASGLSDEWCEHDDHSFPLLDMVFSTVGIQFTLADLVFNGVFARNPDLTFLCIESTAAWMPFLLGAGASDVAEDHASGGGSVGTAMSGGVVNPNGMTMDAAYRVRKSATGRSLYELDMLPSEYLRSQVRVAVTSSESIDQYLAAGMGDMIMFGGDYPHPEGLSDPRVQFEQALGPVDDDVRAKLLGLNVGKALKLV